MTLRLLALMGFVTALFSAGQVVINKAIESLRGKPDVKPWANRLFLRLAAAGFGFGVVISLIDGLARLLH